MGLRESRDNKTILEIDFLEDMGTIVNVSQGLNSIPSILRRKIVATATTKPVPGLATAKETESCQEVAPRVTRGANRLDRR